MNDVFALVDERISDKCLDSLKSYGFLPIKLPKIEGLPTPIASHTDIITFNIHGKLFFSKSYFDAFFDVLSPLFSENIIVTPEMQGGKYPLDAIFNGLLIGDKLFCKCDTFSKEILAHAKKLGIKVISVKQGYPACTALKISENAAVTADRGMANALRGEGISVLDIENGGIYLPPYEYGFIGGAGALYGDTVFFLGDISKHPYADKILSFIKENGKRAVSLSDEPLSDLGGIVFIEKYIQHNCK